MARFSPAIFFIVALLFMVTVDDMKTQVNAEPPCDKLIESGEPCTVKEDCFETCRSKFSKIDPDVEGLCEKRVTGQYRCVCHVTACE
ncbi:hypothetical protein AQUCO_01100427v1 [Aquilegia coerulea]|uniref:Uncharacterized protein n=1 Tax=Aquilegia coerulea TaxID=218851 RepID=A0A2G5E722_AQUCA|nr:hypothetical protein AQUCO_01100427v1 [Aquilegia coerulea]